MGVLARYVAVMDRYLRGVASDIKARAEQKKCRASLCRTNTEMKRFGTQYLFLQSISCNASGGGGQTP